MGCRWYVNMKRSVQLGKGGNNFTGGYFSGMIGYKNTNDTRPNDTYFAIGAGYQMELGRKFFFDLGVSWTNENNDSVFLDFDNIVVLNDPFVRFKIGRIIM